MTVSDGIESRRPSPLRIIDGALSVSAADFEHPEMGVCLPHARVAYVPPGEIEFHHVGARHIVDLHGDVATARLAMGSDRFEKLQPVPDSIGFVPSGCSLKLHGVNLKPTVVAFVDSDWMAEIVQDAQGIPTFSPTPLIYRRDDRVDLIKQALAREAASPIPDRLVIESAVTKLCLRLAEMLSQRRMSVRASNRLHTSIFRAVELAESNLGDGLTIAPLAREAGLSHFHFIRIFREVTGETPFAYIRRRRLENAMMKLRTTSLPISEVALDCGFTHQSHLTEAMRIMHLTTPAKYRAALQDGRKFGMMMQ
jgi:AraC-like DNA-binding protein